MLQSPIINVLIEDVWSNNSLFFYKVLTLKFNMKMEKSCFLEDFMNCPKIVGHHITLSPNNKQYHIALSAASTHMYRKYFPTNNLREKILT